MKTLLSSFIPMKYFIVRNFVIRRGWDRRDKEINCQKKPVIHTRKHTTSWYMKTKEKDWENGAHWSLRLIPSSTFVKTPEHTNMSWKKQKQWVKPAWIQIPAPLCVHWIISGKRLHISESQEKPDLLSGLTRTTTGPGKSFYKRDSSWTRSSLILLHVLCAFSAFGSLYVSALYLSFFCIADSANTGFNILTPSVCIPSFLTSILPVTFQTSSSLR